MSVTIAALSLIRVCSLYWQQALATSTTEASPRIREAEAMRRGEWNATYLLVELRGLPKTYSISSPCRTPIQSPQGFELVRCKQQARVITEIQYCTLY
jgi:hypothetical protein